MTFEEKLKRAKEMRTAAMFGVVDLDDKNATEVPSLYPVMKYDGALIKAGTRINFDEVLYKAASDLWDREENNPVNAPTLWEVLNYVNGVRVIPEVITVTTAFAKNELGYWKKDESTYKSLVDANVYTPEAYSANWEKQEG